MIVYKWVIKKDNKYYPIINNGAYKPFTGLNLGYYIKGRTISNYINPFELIPLGNIYHQRDFHRTGFHFWNTLNNLPLERYNKTMKYHKNTEINCTLKCYIREKDIIKRDAYRTIAKKFRILEEIK